MNEENQYLESVCEKIRHGQPVGLIEAIAAIRYYEAREANKQRQSLWHRVRSLFGRRPNHPPKTKTGDIA